MKVETDRERKEAEISVRQTTRLAEIGKGWPERVAVAYISRALEDLGLRYRIKWDFPPVEGISDPKNDAGQALRDWSDKIQNGSEPGLAKDADLLLTTKNGGGIAYRGQNAAICPAGTLTRDFTDEMKETVKADDPQHPIYGILHELGHCFGVEHNPNWGKTWTDDENEVWFRTPNASGGNINLCGESLPKRPDGYEKRDYLYYHSCARDHMTIK